MPALELSGLFICAGYLIRFATTHPTPGRFLRRLLLIAASAWMVEQSAIMAYGFYRYHEAWLFRLDRVPLLVVLTWPIIVHSAIQMASQIFPQKTGCIRATAMFIVATDALFIETLSVQAGLWAWRYPGLFKVPLIGISGWVCFAAFWIFFLTGKSPAPRRVWVELAWLLFSVAGTHLLLLFSWGALFRWITVPLKAPAAVLCIWSLSALLVMAVIQHRNGLVLSRPALLLRLPAALFFFSLLLFSLNPSLWLLLFATAYIPPYLTLLILPGAAPNRLCGRPAKRSSRR